MIQCIGQAVGDLLGNRINEVIHSASSLPHFYLFFSLCLSRFLLFSLALYLCSLLSNGLWLSNVNCLQLWVNGGNVKLPRGNSAVVRPLEACYFHLPSPSLLIVNSFIATLKLNLNRFACDLPLTLSNTSMMMMMMMMMLMMMSLVL